MNFLQDSFQYALDNPISTFLGFLGAITTFISLYRERVLLRSLINGRTQTPKILFYILGLAWLISLFLVSKPRKRELHSLADYKQIKNQKFGVQQVSLDGKYFENCVFDGTELIFTGDDGFYLVNCTGRPSAFTFNGAATNTMTMLGELYRNEGTRALVENTINNIKTGKYQRPTPVNNQALDLRETPVITYNLRP